VDLTPMMKPNVHGVEVTVLGKCEFMNPGLSHKDRIVVNMLDKAEAAGKIKQHSGCTLVAASSGNTGASVAMIGAMRGYRCVIITNDKCSVEKQDAIKMYGAELLVVPKGVCYMQKEIDLAAENPTWYPVNQYDNLDNPEAHYLGTGPEIYEQTNQTVTHFIMGASTGGTISGVGKYLKEQDKSIEIVLVDPIGSVLAGYKETGAIVEGDSKKYFTEGVGKNNIPGALDVQWVDSTVRYTDNDAFSMCHRLAAEEGLSCGGSAGLNAHAALELGSQVDKPAVIVTLLCDSGVKYLSKVFNSQWLKENNFDTPEDVKDSQARL